MNFDQLLEAAQVRDVSTELIETWIPRSKFVSAECDESSLSITRVSKPWYGMAFGPSPKIDSRWNEFSVTRSTPLELTEQFRSTGAWDVYGIQTQPFDVEYRILSDFQQIDGFIEKHAPTSSIRTSSDEVVAWIGIADVALGALCKWESGRHVLSAIVVANEKRGNGFGKSVTGALISEAHRRGIGYVALGVFAENAAAIATYKGLGFSELAQFNSFSTEVI